MGCACLGGSQVEQFLTDFIDELRIRTFTDKKFTDFVEKYNPFTPSEGKISEFLVAVQRNNLAEHEKYTEDLLSLPRQYLCLALLFLTNSSPKSLSGHYLILVDRLKNKFSDVFSKRLDDFFKTDYDLLKTALLFYCRMISYDVVDACVKAAKVKLSHDQANQLKSMYSAAVIEHYVSELFKGCNTANLDHDDFFQKNHQNIQHQLVRERLRGIWTNKFSPIFQKDSVGAQKEGKIYTLNSNVELEKSKVDIPLVQAEKYVTEYVSEPTQIVSARAPVYTTASAINNANPMNATVYIPSQQQNSGVRRTIDLTNGSGLSLVASGNRTVTLPQTQSVQLPTQFVEQNKFNYDFNNLVNQQPQFYSNMEARVPATAMETQWVQQNNYPTTVVLNNPSNLVNQQPNLLQETQRVGHNYGTQVSNELLNIVPKTEARSIPDSQLTSDIPSLVASGRPLENVGAYIDPYNNATNKFLYGKEKIDATDVKNLPTKLFMTLKQFRKECLNLHNETRKLHQVPELVEDPALTERAQQWANSVAELDMLNHSNLLWEGKIVGENIAKGSALLEDPAKLVCGKWYSEITNYNFSAPGAQPNTKNFTQMVWKETKQIGMGLAYSKSGSTYVVVNYFPAGNDESRLTDNVLPADKN